MHIQSHSGVGRTDTESILGNDDSSQVAAPVFNPRRAQVKGFQVDGDCHVIQSYCYRDEGKIIKKGGDWKKVSLEQRCCD